jgi:hypothetical protein
MVIPGASVAKQVTTRCTRIAQTSVARVTIFILPIGPTEEMSINLLIDELVGRNSNMALA